MSVDVTVNFRLQISRYNYILQRKMRHLLKEKLKQTELQDTSYSITQDGLCVTM